MVFRKTETELTYIKVHHSFAVSVHVDYIDSSCALLYIMQHERMVFYFVVYNKLNTKRFMLPKGQSKAVYRRTDNTMAKRKEVILLLVLSRSSKRCSEYKYFCRPGESFDVL
jgi:hypothetical protein